MIKFILLFLILRLVHADKPWKQCYGVEYLHYDKACCEAQSKYSDSNRHCIESLPKLEYDKAIAVLNSTLDAMTICNSANTCSEDIDFLEIVRQVENLHNITNGGATLAEGAADHLEAQSANLNTINTGILPSISVASSATLHSLTGSSIIVQNGATFELPNIEFTGTAENPTYQAHLDVASIEASVNFNSHELSNANLAADTRVNHVPITISASELNVLQNASVSAAELSKLVGMDTTTQELNQLAGLRLTSQQVASVHALPIVYKSSATTRYAGSTASTLSEAKDACDANAQCDGYSEAWAQSLTFSITNGKVMPGTLGTAQAMPNNHISDCTNLITDNSHYGILVDTGANTCQVISNGNRDASTWTDDASKKLYVRNSEISYGTATTGLPIISYVKGVGRSAPSKALTADADGNVQIMQNVTIEGDLDVPVGEINIEGTALTVTALQLNQAGQLHGELTASLQEINTMDGVLSTVAELNTMSGVTADTADLNRADITTQGISAASKVVTADAATGKVVLQDAQASVDASVFNLNGASIDAATLNKAIGLTAPLNTINNALLGAESMTFNVDLNVDALNVAEGNLKIGTEAITATAAEMNVLDGVTLTTQQLSKLKTMPTTIDTTVVNGLYATTAELNYADLAGSIGSAEASKVVSSDATTLAKMQKVDANVADVAMTYSLRTTGDYDQKMTLQDCQDAAFGTFSNIINTDVAPKGCVYITPISLYNEHASGSGTCAGAYACIVKTFVAGNLKIQGANMPSAETLNHLDVTLQATHDSLNHWQSLDAAVLASHLNPMQGLTAEKTDLDRLDIVAEGQVEANKVLTTDALDAVEFGVSKRMIMTSSTDAIEVSSLGFEADVSPTAMNKMIGVTATTDELNYIGNVLTADGSGNVEITGDASVTGLVEIGTGGSGRIGLGGTDIVINAVQLDTALRLHKNLTITAAEANTLDNIQATTAELNKMAGAQVTTAEINYVDTTVGATEASKAAIYGSKIVFADLASTEIDAATLKINGAAVTSTAAELNIASSITSDLIPELNKLSSAPSTDSLNTFATTTSTIAELNLLDGAVVSASDLNKLKDVTSTATELNKLSTASSAAQINAMSTTATAVELNAAVLVAGSDAAISVTDATVATLDTTNIGGDLTVTAAELDAHAADLGSVLSSGIQDFTSVSNINLIDKFRAPSTAQYNILAGLGSASDLNAYATTDRATVTNVNSDFCDNKLPGTLVNKGDDLYFCLGDECAETATCEYRENGNIDKTVFKTRTCSHDMQHFTGLRDECPVGKCRIDERHQVKKTCHQSANPNHGSALSFAGPDTSSYVINGAADPEVRVCANEAISFIRSDAGHPLRVVTAADCAGCDSGTHSFPSSSLENWVDVQGSSTGTYTFTNTGNYYYLCTAHANMVGSLIVEDCNQDFNGEIGTGNGQCERKYEYSDSTAIFSGTVCTDTSDCEAQCAADAACEGFTYLCSDEQVCALAFSASSDIYAGDSCASSSACEIACSKSATCMGYTSGKETTFGPMNTISTKEITFSSSSNMVTNFEIADLDGDGDQDIIVASWYTVVWFENLDGKGNYGAYNGTHNVTGDYYIVYEPPTTSANGGIKDFKLADINGDGKIDILFGNYNQGKIYWSKNNGDKTFTNNEICTDRISAFQSNQIDTLDVDNDGDLDFLMYKEAPKQLQWYENVDGQGTFNLPANVIDNAGYQLGGLSVADIDGDGYIDVLVSASYVGAVGRRNGQSIGWYKNKGDKTFEVRSDLAFPSASTIVPDATGTVTYDVKSWYVVPWDNIATDIDGDGDMDIVASIWFNLIKKAGDIVWYENLDGQGTFSSFKIIDTRVDNAQSLVATDLDNDGDMDILCVEGYYSSSSTHRLLYYENLDGSGTFSTYQQVDYLTNVEKLRVGDVNGDGFSDVMALVTHYDASRVHPNVRWFENIPVDAFTYGVIDNSITVATQPGPTIDRNGNNWVDITTGYTKGFAKQGFVKQFTYGALTAASGGSSKQRDDVTLAIEVSEDCTSSDTVHCSDPVQVTTNVYSYASSVKVFDGASCNDLADCKQQCTDDPACEGYTSACSLVDKATEETCGTCNVPGKTTELTCGTCNGDASKTTEATCGTCNEDPSKLTSTSCVDTCYDYTSSVKIFSGSDCTDASDCKAQCTASPDCQGFTGTCSDTSRAGNEENCNVCSYSSIATESDCVTFQQVAAGNMHTCAVLNNVLNDNTLKCWGQGSNGELGNGGSEIYNFSPITVDLGTGKTAKQIASGGSHTCAILNDDTVKCWGDGRYGRLGYGGTANQLTPITVDLGTCGNSACTAKHVGTGVYHTCALLNDDTVKCWGYGGNGQLGYGDTSNRGDGGASAATCDDGKEMGDCLPRVDLGTCGNSACTAKQLAVGWSHNCAILNDDTLKCWGTGWKGELGYGDTSIRGDGGASATTCDDGKEMGDCLPTVDLGTNKKAKQVGCGYHFTCAILNDDTLKCWGDGDEGRLGYGDTFDRGDAGADAATCHEGKEMGDCLPPVPLGTCGNSACTAKQVAVGGHHTCAVLNDDTVKCWGEGNYGKLGYGNKNDRGDPSQLPTVDLGTGKTAKQVSAGGQHTCAVLNDDTVKCWGYGEYGQLGYGQTNNRDRGDAGAGAATCDEGKEMGDCLPTVDVGVSVTWFKLSYTYGSETAESGGTSQVRSAIDCTDSIVAPNRFYLTWTSNWTAGIWDSATWNTALGSSYAYGLETEESGGTSQARSLDQTTLQYKRFCPSGTSTSSVSCLAMEIFTAALFTSGSQDFSLNAAECEQFAADNNYIFELWNNNNIHQAPEGCIFRNANWEDPQKIFYVDPDYTGSDQNGGQYYDCGSVINADLNYPCVKRSQCPSTHVFGSYTIAYEPSCTPSDYKTCEAIAPEDKTLCLEQGCLDGSTRDKIACEAAGETYDSSTAANVFYHTEQVNSEAECDGEHTWGYKKFTIRV